MTRLEKELWLWITGSGSKGLRINPTPTRLSPVQQSKVTDLISKMVTSGNAGNRLLLGLRLRSLAYRRAGVQNSSDAACRDALDAYAQDSRPSNIRNAPCVAP